MQQIRLVPSGVVLAATNAGGIVVCAVQSSSQEKCSACAEELERVRILCMQSNHSVQFGEREAFPRRLLFDA